MPRVRSISLIITSLLLLCSSVLWHASAQSSQLNFTLSPSDQAAAAGAAATFTGTLTNTGGTTLFLNDISLTLNHPGLSLDTSPFFDGTPVTLAGGQNWTGAIFRVNVAASTPPGAYTGRVNILGGGDILAQDTLASQDFTIDVSNFVVTCGPANLTFRQGCVAPPAGIDAWWPADNTTTDIAGNHCGALQNGAAFAQGLVGQAYSFDGVDDYVLVPDSPAWDFGSDDFTIELWVRFDQIKNAMLIHHEGTQAVPGWEFHYTKFNGNDPDVLVFTHDGADHNTAILRNWFPVAHTWYHLAVTRAGGAYRLYVNGAQLGASKFVSTPVPNVAGDLRIGDWAYGTSGNQFSDYHLDGLMDEPSIYRRALPQSELQSIYDAGSAGKCQIGCASRPSGQVGWWRGEGNANDSARNHHGALQNGATFSPGQAGQAFSFDGSSWMEAPDQPDLNVQQFTIDAWVFHTQRDSGEDMIVNKETFGQDPFIQYEIGVRGTDNPGEGVAEGNFIFYIGGITGLPGDYRGFVNSNAAAPLNTWTHVALTFDGTSAKTYVNGMLTRTVDGLGGTVVTTAGPLRIGARSQAPNAANFTGKIDEADLFDRALSASEIQALYHAGSTSGCRVLNPALSVGDVTINEPDSGTATATFNVALVPASSLPVTVSYSTADDTAVAPDDYVPASGTLSFNPGETLKTINVTVKADAVSEADETFFVNLSGASVGAPLADAQGQGTITSPKVTALVSSANPSVFGQAIAFTATVSRGAEGAPVTFKDETDTLGRGALDGSGQATFTTSALSIGGHTVTAEYGDGAPPAISSRPCNKVQKGRRLSDYVNTLCPERRAAQLIFNMNAPTSLAQVVNKADTAASLKTTLSRAISGQNVTLRADVAPTAPGSGTPTGAVTFKDGADTLGTVTLNASGQAGFNTSSLAVRDHIITAVYAGDERFNGSTSGVLTQSIKAGADLSVEATASPTSVMAGVKVTYAVTVTNHGTDPAADVKLEDPLPAGLTYLSATTSQGSCAPSQGEVLCLLGGMDAGANAQISIKARPTVAGELTNVFTAMGEMLDPSTANNVAETTINVTPALPGSVIISEFRFRGPGAVLAGAINAAPAPGGGIKRAGVARRPPPRNDIVSAANDEFVEFYNNTDSEIAVGATDGSAGWALVASDGQVRFIIPAGVTIPARGHFLAVNTMGYSLSAYAAGDPVLLPDGVTESGGYTTDIPDGSGITLFRTANPSNFTSDERLDAAGYQGVDQLYREGAGLPPGGAETTVNLEYSFFRDMRTPGGLPKDTSDNLADFLCAETSGAMLGAGQSLGAPGPENLSSPVNRNASVSASLLDTNSGAQNAPNRVRDLQQDPGHNSTFGTLSIRRTITNTTGGPITRLRFRVMDVTTFPPPLGSADLRVLTSPDVVVTLSGTAQCAPDTPPCQVKAFGTTLEQPAAQPSGGGWNSSLAAGMVTLAAPLADSDKISVQFLLGVQRTGAFRFYVSVEALP